MNNTKTLKVEKSNKVSKNSDPTSFKTKHRAFWSHTLANLQRLGKSLMFPIAVLPFAALLNRFGTLAIDLNPTVDGVRNAGNWIGFILQTPGGIVFNNLSLIFAIGTAFGLSKDNRGESALVGAVLYIALTTFLGEHGLADLFYKKVLPMDYWAQDATGNWHQISGYSQLFYVPNFAKIDPLGTGNGSLEVVGGTFILDIGVLGGIVAGCMSAYLYNKFRDIKLPMALSFFGGRRFVPMMVMIVSIPLAFIFAIIWPWIQFGLVKFGQLLVSSDAWAVPGAFLYALVNRFIQPFGLHHILNTFLWFQLPVENYIVDVTGKIIIGSDVITHSMDNHVDIDASDLSTLQQIADNWKGTHAGIQLTAENWDKYFNFNPAKFDDADGTILSMGEGKYAVFGDINAFQRSVVSGNFQTGYFPMYWGGLPGAALAMIMTAKKENKKSVSAFLLGVAIVAMLTGIDEPIVFSFIFVAPILWAYNAIFTAIFAAVGVAMHMHIGFGFSGGLIDYIISFPNSWGMSKFEGFANSKAYGVTSNPLWMLLLATIMFPIYYFSFYYTIKLMNLPTPGRGEDNVPVQPTTKKTSSKDGKKVDKYDVMADEIIELVGEENIVTVDNCATRLRLTVKDNSIDKVGSDDKYKALGAFGVKRLGDEGFQIIIGTDVEHVANKVHDKTGK